MIPYSDEIKQKILEYIERGNYFSTACILARVPKATGNDWLRRGKEGESPYDDFYGAVNEAKAKSEQSLLDVVRNAAKGIEQSKTRVRVTKTISEDKEVIVEESITETESKPDSNAAKFLLERGFFHHWGKVGDLNQALTSLRNYGIDLKLDDAGRWFVEEIAPINGQIEDLESITQSTISELGD